MAGHGSGAVCSGIVRGGMVVGAGRWYNTQYSGPLVDARAGNWGGAAEWTGDCDGQAIRAGRWAISGAGVAPSGGGGVRSSQNAIFRQMPLVRGGNESHFWLSVGLTRCGLTVMSRVLTGIAPRCAWRRILPACYRRLESGQSRAFPACADNRLGPHLPLLHHRLPKVRAPSTYR
jgi:hypothetical protein